MRDLYQKKLCFNDGVANNISKICVNTSCSYLLQQRLHYTSKKASVTSTF